MNFYQTNDLTAVEAQRQAYWIAYAPFIFQITRVVVNTGMLKLIKDGGKVGRTIEEVSSNLGLTEYASRVLLHASLGINLIHQKDDKFFLSKTGFFILTDRSVKVTMDFSHDVCYQGLFSLEESIKSGKPEGLKVFGSWNTIYEALSVLPKKVQESWFNLDHYYSDVAFPKAIPILLKYSPKNVIDIGGNTGKFTKLLLNSSETIHVAMLDLPGQIEMAKANILNEVDNNRISFYGINLLDESQIIPTGHDMIWMSQFLDCFSEEQIVAILTKCLNSLEKNGKIIIQEGFWDKQKYETSAFSLQQFSLYFTALANGNSQMYDYATFSKCLKKAGLKIHEEFHNLSISNSILVCEKA